MRLAEQVSMMLAGEEALKKLRVILSGVCEGKGLMMETVMLDKVCVRKRVAVLAEIE